MTMLRAVEHAGSVHGYSAAEDDNTAEENVDCHSRLVSTDSAGGPAV
jgi:hypothetical protein